MPTKSFPDRAIGHACRRGEMQGQSYTTVFGVITKAALVLYDTWHLHRLAPHAGVFDLANFEIRTPQHTTLHHTTPH